MNGNVERVRLGAAHVTFDGQNLGLTKGGIELIIVSTTYKAGIDQHGDVDTDNYITARTVRVKVPLAETTIENFANAMPGTKLVIDNSGKKKLEGHTAISTSLINLSKKLVIHPADLPASNVSEDIVIPYASCKGDLNFFFKHDEEKIYTVEFTGYTNPSNSILFVVGDESASDGNNSVMGGTWNDAAMWNDLDTWKDN